MYKLWLLSYIPCNCVMLTQMLVDIMKIIELIKPIIYDKSD